RRRAGPRRRLGGGSLPRAAGQAPGRHPLPAATPVGIGGHRGCGRGGLMSVPASRDHAWLPRATCDTDCLRIGGYEATRLLIVALRVTRRITLLLLLAPALPLLAGVIPGWAKSRQIYCRMLLWC